MILSLFQSSGGPQVGKACAAIELDVALDFEFELLIDIMEPIRLRVNGRAKAGGCVYVGKGGGAIRWVH